MLAFSTTALAATAVDERPGAEGEWGWRPAVDEAIPVNPPRFSWRPQERARSYVVEASHDANFATLDYHADHIEFNVHAPAREFETGQWWWRVAFVDAKGERSNWSQARRF